MTGKEEEFIKSTFRWPFSWRDFLLHYPILIAPIIMILFSFTKLLSSYSFMTLLSLIFGLLLTFFIVYRIERERRFHIITIDSNTTFNEILDKLESLKWITLESTVDRLQFLDKVSFFSDGVYVTIIKYADKKVLVNTKPFGSQPFTLYRDITNYNKIKRIIQ